MFTFFRIKILFPKSKAKNINMETKNSFSGIYFLPKLKIPIYNFNQCVIIFPVKVPFNRI